MAATTLNVTPAITQLDLGVLTELTVETNATDYTVTINDPDAIIFRKLTRENTKILELYPAKLSEEGTNYTIKIEATAEGGDKASKEIYVKTIVIETTLEVTTKPTELTLAESTEITVTTNASQYLITSSNPEVIVIGNEVNKLIAIGSGESTIKVAATKENSVEKTVEWVITVPTPTVATESGESVNIKLVNQVTGRTITLGTSNNESEEDLKILLPDHSGTLITEESLNTQISILSQPYIIEPKNLTENFVGDFIASPYDSILGIDPGTVTATWEVARDEEFANVILRRTKTVGDINRIALTDAGFGAFYVRVKYEASTYVSKWSVPIYISMGVAGFHGLTVPIKTQASTTTAPTGTTKLTDLYDGAYYGIVENNQLVTKYDYLGPWNLMKLHYNQDLYLSYNNTPLTKPICFDANDQVYHNGKLWYALEAVDATTTDDMIEPGSNPAKWAEDTRTAIVPPSEICRLIGVGVGKTDNNADGMSSENVAIGDLVNDDAGYIKYIYKGKLCYTPKKPVCEQIAWTDLAKRDVVYKERTVRLGGHLYWCRLFTEAEYRELFRRLTNGVYASLDSSADLGLETACWAEDKSSGNNRKLLKMENDTITVENNDPKARVGAWRYVLEYIPENCAPYKQPMLWYDKGLPKASTSRHTVNDDLYNGELIDVGTGETFIYDKYTDTGYFGVVTSDDFTLGSTLATAINFNIGTQQHDNAGFLKFYWHGKILYMAKKPFRYNVSFNQIKTTNCMFGKDMGANDLVQYTWNDIAFNVCCGIGATSAPYETSAINYSWSANKMVIEVLETHVGKYAQYPDLIFRLTDQHVGFKTQTGTNWVGNEMEEMCCYTYGGNWEALETTEIIVKYDTDGTGTANYGREINVNGTCSDFGYYGFGKWHSEHALSNVYADSSWRPILFTYPIESE